MSEPLSRRAFFAHSALYSGSLWMLLNAPRPLATRAAQESTRREVLSEAEWKIIEAITGRIIPADREPGAIEAGCVNFIDKALAHEDAAMKPVYRAGLLGIDTVSKRRFAKPFVELAPDQQDEILAALEAGKAEGWPPGDVSSEKFFETVRVHTIIGFLADPKYGGNRDYVGWKVMGYPGPRHHMGGYTAAQMVGKEKIKAVWGDEI